MTCKLCSIDSTFKLCTHGACVICRVAGACAGCEHEAATTRIRFADDLDAASVERNRRLMSLPPREYAAWIVAFCDALENGVLDADSFAWASVRTDFPHLRITNN